MSLNELIQSLTQQDVDTLQSIYSYRCLNRDLLYQIHFKDVVPTEASAQRMTTRCINRLLNYGLIREEEYLAGNIVYFLTPNGIEVMRHFFSLPTNIYDSRRKVVRRGYYRASELDIYPRLINHQIHLNRFVVDFMEKKPDVPLRYYDEKYASQYSNIRPDGIISFPDVDVFLEMDMATESKNQLCDKWENYRNFLNSMEYELREKKIIVLFIVGNTARVQEREDAVKYTIYERLLDLIDGEFDIVIGNHEELLDYLLNRVIPSFTGNDKTVAKIEKTLHEYHGFSMSDGEKLAETLQNTQFRWYGRRLNESGKIIVENGKIQEFLVDEYLHEPVSSIAKIVYLDKHNLFFEQKYKRKISYLLIVDSVDQIRTDLKMTDALGIKNVYYTTKERLQKHPFHLALFQFDLMGNIYHFSDDGLKERHFEATEAETKEGVDL